MRLPSLFIVLALGGCGESPPPADEIPRIEGPPSNAPTTEGMTVALGPTPTTVSSVDGVVVVGTSDGVYRTSLSGTTAEAVRVFAGDGRATSVGHVTAIVPRASRGFFVAAKGGLLHDQESVLVVSPFTPLLEGENVDSLDVTGSGADEALWITTPRSSFVRRDVGATSLSLSTAPIKRAIGIDATHALLFADGIYEADVDAGAVRRRGEDPGEVRGFARDDGSIYVATSRGLLVRRANGDLAVHTFAGPGAAPRAIRAVGAGYGTVAVLADDSVVAMDAAGSRIVGHADGDATGIAIDANEDLWVASPRGLSRFATGKPVSFEADVKPFMVQRCMPCHGGGGGAPTRSFDTFEVAQSFATDIVRRLRGDGRPVMPPSGGLRAADFRAVVRWAQTGTPR